MSGQVITFLLLTSVGSFLPDAPEGKEAETGTVHLMQPSGPFQVGHIMLDWTDSTRKEPATEEPSDFRQVPVQIWYPAGKDSHGEPSAGLRSRRIRSAHSEWQQMRYGQGGPGPHLRTIFCDQGCGKRNGPRTGHGLWSEKGCPTLWVKKLKYRNSKRSEIPPHLRSHECNRACF